MLTPCLFAELDSVGVKGLSGFFHVVFVLQRVRAVGVRNVKATVSDDGGASVT